MFTIPKPTPPPRQPFPANKGPQLLTSRIRVSEVRLIDGEENSIVSREEAERIAEERGLDLLIVSLDSSPAVVRLVDYGKFKFEAEKKAREAKKKQHVMDVKEIKLGIRIDQHDYWVKMHRAQQFLSEGDKVKVTIRLKGREIQHKDLAVALGQRVVVDLQDHGAIEGAMRMEGRMMILHFNPVKHAEKPAAPKAPAEQVLSQAPGEASPHAQDENP